LNVQGDETNQAGRNAALQQEWRVTGKGQGVKKEFSGEENKENSF